jgi:hypothetical protein
MKALIFVSCAVLLVFASCKRPQADIPPPTEAQVSEGREKLLAAMQISTMSTRDEALREVALDAAKVQSTDIAKQAVEKISTMSIKDETAEACALSLARAGQAGPARELADLISTSSIRDRTLSAIATGK